MANGGVITRLLEKKARGVSERKMPPVGLLENLAIENRRDT